MPFKLFILLSVTSLFSGCTHLFFQPSKAVFLDPAAEGFKYEVLKFASADGTALTGMFFAPDGAPLGTVVHFHGNAQNMTSHFQYSAWLAKEGFNVIIFDYRGYGASEGRPNLDGLVMDGVAALALAARLPGALPGKMVIMGQSLGGAIAVAAVAQAGLKPAAMILEGTFYSYKGVAAAALRRYWLTWPMSWLPYVAVSGRYSPADYIGKIACPKLFIHSPGDQIVPFPQGKKLYDASPAPKEFWRIPSGHIEAFGSYRETYGPQLVALLKTALKD